MTASSRPAAALAAAPVLFALAAPVLSADRFPSRPLRMVVPLPAGSASDFLARTLGQPLSEALKEQLVVDNRPGAGGLIGSAIVAKATPDGHTLAMIAPPHIAAALLNASPPYRPVEDFTAVAEVASIPNVIVAAPALNAKTLPEMIAQVRQRPGDINYASLGIGTSAHLAAEILNRAAGVRTTHIPFKVIPDVYAEMLAGRVHFYVFTVPSSLAMIKDGKVRALAVTSAKRSQTFPDLPTVAEAGLPGAQSEAWFGVVAPSKTPATVVARLHGEIVKVLRSPETRERFGRQGAEPAVDTTPARFTELLKNETVRYQQVIRDAGIKPQ